MVMRKTQSLKIIFMSAAVILPLFFFSCGSRHDVKSTMRQMMKSGLVIPSDLRRIDGYSISGVSSERKEATLLIYYDSLVCGSCMVSKLNMLDTLYGLERTFPDFEVLTVFSPRAAEAEDIQVLQMKRRYAHPVYLDYSGSFREANTFIPADSRFHTFLVNGEGTPIFIGNPMVSGNMWKLFIDALHSATVDRI